MRKDKGKVRADGVAQVVERLPRKYTGSKLNLSTTKINK
jgi:hypothetical protein